MSAAGAVTMRSGRMDQLLWKVNRLRCMSPAEIGHRVVRMLQIHGEKLMAKHAVPAADLSLAPRAWIRVPTGLDAAPYLAAAERLIAGRFDVFAMEDADLGSPPRWNRDPRTGIEAPLTFGKLIDYRNPAVVGDIKYLWEPNRHLHLVTLAQACALSTSEEQARRYAETLRVHLESWFDACPYPLGANWSSALEPGIRMINWSLAWQLLGGADAPVFRGAQGERFRHRWLESVYQHAQYVHGHFSLYSSANNHLVGEASGLYLAALTWPLWAAARTWKTAAREVLEREALLQNAPDGVNREQAVSYQQWELDLLLLPLLAAEAAGEAFPDAYRSRIEAMLEYLASIMDAGGNLPMFGDADDGYVARLSQQPGFCRYRSLLATGALLFGRGDFKAKAGAVDDKTRWLLGPGTDGDYATLVSRPEALPVRRAFPQGGYYILGCDFESPKEIRLVADAGPLGYQAIAAHGHADALSFTLSVGGKEFLVDPGTYAYHTQGEWRQYFRGTSAHNTLRVDGQDQSVPGGNFMWLKKASAGCRIWRSTGAMDEFDGWQDGYMRLDDAVMHERRIVLRKAERLILVEDRLQASGGHEAELFFHCSEDCTVEEEGGGYRITQEGFSIYMELPRLDGAEVRLHRGSSEPVSGWVSRRFDVKVPATTIAWRAKFCGALILRTLIRC